MNAPASTAPDVLAVLDQAAAREVLEMRAPLIEARAAVAELIERSEKVAATLETPLLVRPSGKNPNAGFIDRRDWYALVADVAALRATLTRVGGGK